MRPNIPRFRMDGKDALEARGYGWDLRPVAEMQVVVVLQPCRQLVEVRAPPLQHLQVQTRPLPLQNHNE